MKLALARKPTTTTSPADIADYRAQIKATPHDAKIEELRALRRAVETQISEVGSSGEEKPISPDQQKIHLRVLALLGEPLPDVPQRNWEGPLQSLRLDRDAIDLALEILGQKQAVERAQRIAEELRVRSDEWSASTRNLALKLAEVLEIVRWREEFKTNLVGPSGPPILPCDVSLARSLKATGEVQKFFEECIRAGIISKKEATL